MPNTTGHVLLVEDQTNVRRTMAMLLEQDGHRVEQAASAAHALALLAERAFDVVVTDVRMEGALDGTGLLQTIRAQRPETEVIMATAYGTIADAVAAIKSGAYDYLTKPIDPERLVITVRRAIERRALAREVRELRAQVDSTNQIVCVSPAMRQVLRSVEQLAASDSTVLITGESGTGKELVARALYLQSTRRHRRFVPVNCGAIAETILESELFGHRKGAFTGAINDKKGLLEEAHGGVLFLDEIGEMPPAMQVRLLRFLQDGEVRRVGDTQTRSVDIRLITATHRSLEDEVACGRLRQDFYYRINVVQLRIPPLRERPADIPALADLFLKRFAARLCRPVVGFTEEAWQAMAAYRWPGNVRELENAVERAVNMAAGAMVGLGELPPTLWGPSEESANGPTEQEEKGRLIGALERCHWNQRRAAASLGISRTTLWRKMREHRIVA
jgi:DNA-binding NtrC family response regulator